MASGEHGIELLVKKMAHKMIRRLPSCVQIEDLFQAGMIGWITAKSKYDDSFKIPFDKFALIYIHGAIINSLREGSWVPRSVSKYERLIREARKELEDQGIFDPSDVQLAEYLNIPLRKYQKFARDAINIYLLDLEEDVPSDDNVYETIESEYVFAKLRAALDLLTPIQRKLVSMHYNEDICITDIAREFKVTEVEGRKILRNSLASLKKAMSHWHPAK